jgi:NADH-quinone oxidoreductase subunit J
MMENVIFAVGALIVLAGAVGVVATRSPVYAAMSLVTTLFGVAVLFLSLDANFLAAVQVIVYAGAVVVLFLFVIMLLGVDRLDDLRARSPAGSRPPPSRPATARTSTTSPACCSPTTCSPSRSPRCSS